MMMMMTMMMMMMMMSVTGHQCQLSDYSPMIATNRHGRRCWLKPEGLEPTALAGGWMRSMAGPEESAMRTPVRLEVE